MNNSPLPTSFQAQVLIQQQLFGVLSTFSVKEEGFPYGSMTPFCLDLSGYPILMISDLAQHTRNLRVHPKAALTIFSGAEAETQHRSQRLCLMAEANFLQAHETAELSSRYARYFPEEPDLRIFKDFHLVRLNPHKIHLVAGFGKIDWFEGQELIKPSPFPLTQEQAFVEDINTDEADFLAACWIALTGKSAQEKVSLIGIDNGGGDLRSGSRRQRFYFTHPVNDLRQAWEHLKRAAIQLFE